jgi:hypothetical protein
VRGGFSWFKYYDTCRNNLVVDNRYKMLLQFYDGTFAFCLLLQKLRVDALLIFMDDGMKDSGWTLHVPLDRLYIQL